MQSTIHINDIILLDISNTPISSCSIDLPKPDTNDTVQFFELSGTLISNELPILGIQIIHDEFVLKRTAVNQPRPDLGKQFPHLQHTDRNWFRTYIGVTSLPEYFELIVRAVLPGKTDQDEDRLRIPIAIIKGRHSPINSNYRPKRQPLTLTALGRSGTTWLMHLLSQHQAITSINKYPYEVRAGVYWMHMLNILTTPGNHDQSTPPDGFESDLFGIGHCPYYHPFYFDQLDSSKKIKQFFGINYVNKTAAYCQENIDRYYDAINMQQSTPNSRYFLEKGIGGQIPFLYKNTYEQPREIVLIRDCRDMYCSSTAFNKKRGFAGFGRERVNTDDQWLEILHRSYSRIIKGWQSRKNESHLVRYEDLILKPEKTLHEILCYLDIDNPDTIIHSMIDSASQDTPDMEAHRTSSNPKSSIGRWKSEMDKETVDKFNNTFSELLDIVGYTF